MDLSEVVLSWFWKEMIGSDFTARPRDTEADNRCDGLAMIPTNLWRRRCRSVCLRRWYAESSENNRSQSAWCCRI